MRIAKRITEKSINEAIKNDKFCIYSGIEEGLFLQLKSVKQPVWRYGYRSPRSGKKQIISFGPLSRVSIADAVNLARDARKSLEAGVDPVDARRRVSVEARPLFADVAKKYVEVSSPGWGPRHIEDVTQKLRAHILPALGEHDIEKISRDDVKQIFDKLHASGKHETLKKVKGVISQIIGFAKIEYNIEGIVDWTKQFERHYKAAPRKNFAAFKKHEDIVRLMKDIESYKEISIITYCALKFSAMTFARPGEIRHAEWKEIDTHERLWRIPAEKMKAKRPHLVPLVRQTLEILEMLRPITSQSKYIFPSVRSNTQCMSEATILAALRRLGYSKDEMTAHGFRSIASTTLNSKNFNPKWVDFQLAHAENDKTAAAYNHAEYLDFRRVMMTFWADYLEALAFDTDVPPLPACVPAVLGAP